MAYILIVDDDEDLAKAFAKVLTDARHEVEIEAETAPGPGTDEPEAARPGDPGRHVSREQFRRLRAGARHAAAAAGNSGKSPFSC